MWSQYISTANVFTIRIIIEHTDYRKQFEKNVVITMVFRQQMCLLMYYNRAQWLYLYTQYCIAHKQPVFYIFYFGGIIIFYLKNEQVFYIVYNNN